MALKFLGFQLKGHGSNSGTIRPRPDQPMSPPLVATEGSAEYFWRECLQSQHRATIHHGWIVTHLWFVLFCCWLATRTICATSASASKEMASCLSESYYRIFNLGRVTVRSFVMVRSISLTIILLTNHIAEHPPWFAPWFSKCPSQVLYISILRCDNANSSFGIGVYFIIGNNHWVDPPWPA